MKRIEEQLLKELDAFTAFARSRVGDDHLAADVVQDSLLKAVKSADQLRDDESVTAWFYRILRRTIIDLYRRRDAAHRAIQRLENELNLPPDAAEEKVSCACVETLIPTLKPEYAELIRELDLAGQTPEQVAAQRGVTANNLRVRHHRARQQLRERVEQTCRLCAKHGCLDCTCERTK
jgi:RNA polymerase sigma factor (sigma-70 family)